MFDAHAGTDFIEGMVTARRLVFHREPVGKLQTVVGQDFGDFDGRGDFQSPQEIDAAAVGHVAIDVQKHPARGAVNGHEQVTTRCLVWHLWRVFDVDVNEARLIVLEGLFWRERFAFCLRDDVLQARHAFALEQARDAAHETAALMYSRVM